MLLLGLTRKRLVDVGYYQFVSSHLAPTSWDIVGKWFMMLDPENKKHIAGAYPRM
jgi:hypothetical protein